MHLHLQDIILHYGCRAKATSRFASFSLRCRVSAGPSDSSSQRDGHAGCSRFTAATLSSLYVMLLFKRMCSVSVLIKFDLCQKKHELVGCLRGNIGHKLPEAFLCTLNIIHTLFFLTESAVVIVLYRRDTSLCVLWGSPHSVVCVENLFRPSAISASI